MPPKVSVSFEIDNPEVNKYINTHAYEFARESLSSLLTRLRDIWNDYLKVGIDAGKTILELTDEVEQVFQGTEREEWFRARRIARTESVGAANMGSLLGYKQAGVNGKEWITMDDGLVRESHENMHGEIVGIDEKFIVDGKEMEGPGDPAGGPEEICNCRCMVQPAFLQENEGVEKIIFGPRLSKGGPGSGNFGHEGRPGEVGGSGEGGEDSGGGGYGNIADKLNLQANIGELKANSTQYKINGGDVYIGGGIGYYPKGGGSPISTEGVVVIGPESWVGEKAHNIPEIVAMVEKEYKESLSLSGGDFNSAQYTENKSIISSLMQNYKSPLTASNTETINLLATAYLNKSIIVGKMTEDALDEEKKQIKRAIETRKTKGLSTELWEKNYGEEYFFNRMSAQIRTARFNKEQVSQESVDQFYSEVKRTQDYLTGKYGTSIKLYRGVKGEYAKAIKGSLKRGEDIDINVRNLTSWTSDESIAKGFAGKGGITLENEFAVKDVLFSHHTTPYIRTSDFAFGGQEEHEFIIGSPNGKLKIKTKKTQKRIDGNKIFVFPNLDYDRENKRWLKNISNVNESSLKKCKY